MGVILAVCKDVGGANALLPVMDLLKKNHRIRWIAQDNGRGKDILRNSGYDFDIFSSNDDAIDKIISRYPGGVDLVVSSMCSTVGQEIARLFRGTCPIVVIQDQWTNGLSDVWIDQEYRPDLVLVNDELDRNFVLRAWPDFCGNIFVTGYPALDKYARLDVQGTKVRVKYALSLSENKPVVMFAGQWWQTGHAVGEAVHALNQLGQDVYFIARPHPAMKDNTPEEVPLWERALTEFRAGTLVDSSSFGISDVLATSDVVLSMFSTTLNEAAILRLPNIAILYPDHGLKVYTDVTKTDEYPLISLGCTARAGNREELISLLDKALNSDLGLRDAQEKAFSLDGRNSIRAKNIISGLI
ncbi:MAG: CDP-glycerol glycerophosphotransferase family protein [Candidatus Yanofskybacteria bacterium]|nr:CDP-glycerol glycerophosphotransferase family protein [Candidatus Yanofskybacteria bacterium]